MNTVLLAPGIDLTSRRAWFRRPQGSTPPRPSRPQGRQPDRPDRRRPAHRDLPGNGLIQSTVDQALYEAIATFDAAEEAPHPSARATAFHHPSPEGTDPMTNASKKRRIRAYMADHGANYTAALRALEAQRPATDKPTSPSKDG